MQHHNPSVQIRSETQTENKLSILVHQIREYLEENYRINIRSECLPFVCRCLKQKDGSVQKTLKLILAFRQVITDFDSWNSILKPSVYSDLYTRDFGYFNPLSQRDDEGRRVFLMRPGETWDPKEASFEELITCVWMFVQYLNAFVEDMQRDGYVIIYDFKNLSMEQGLAMGPSTMMAMTKWGQNGTCGKMKAAHIVNHPRVVNMLYAGCKPFLSDKIKKRILFHKNVESMLEHVPARILPSYLGGTADDDSYRDKTLLYQVIKQDKFFEDILKYGLPTK